MSLRIVLGVAGGIAAYKAAALCSALVQRGDAVDVVMTGGARRFVGETTFAALARTRVHGSLWDEPEAIAHIALARAADVVAIVPATANVLAKLAHGLADDLLCNVALATRAPIVVAPAMNSVMYEHPATRANVATLAARGVAIVEPEHGFLAEREQGVGRLASQDAILAAIDRAAAVSGAASANGVAPPRDLAGLRVAITAGPTREAIDPVRYLSNASTGTTGIELAREAAARGASVDLVLGPTAVAPPPGVRVARVTTAQEMLAAALACAPGADVTIATAAVSDWRPVAVSASKAKKTAGPLALELERTPDILATLGELGGCGFLVGFAAETDDVEGYARGKLARKRLDAIVANDVSGGAGFGTGDNDLVLLWGDAGREALGRASKAELARRLWDALGRLRSERACS